MSRIIFSCLLLLGTLANAQTLTISAKVVDKETKEPLVFATVGILDKPIGTITNMQGDFDFYIPVEFKRESCD